MRIKTLVCCAALALSLAAPIETRAAVFDVTAFGAKADGTTPDRDAINKAIDAAAAAGGGTVYFPAGTYLTGSIRLRSNIALQFDQNSHLVATADGAAYDPVLSSLIVGENVENIAIVGGGLISGTNALVRQGRPGHPAGDKALALRSCRNVTLRDFSILNGGSCAILATGVDNITVENVRIDTNRDGLDFDACRNVRVSDVSVNAPNDDAICLKTRGVVGFSRAVENVTITNVLVSGYDIGSLLDGTYKRTLTQAPDRDGPTGRIKIGTESGGDFKNITISNAVFDRSRGLALESVDGAHIEDVSISNITMRDVSNAPIFIRLGSRMREKAPEGTDVGSIRRVSISNVVVYDADPRYPSTITGVPGHDVEDIKLNNIRILARGGLSLDQVAKQPANLVSTFFFRAPGGVPPREPYETPEREKEYPEPSMFGLLPAYGFFIRHAHGIELNDVEVGFRQEDRRPAFVLDQVSDIDFRQVKSQPASGIPTLVLQKVENFTARDCTPLPDTTIPEVDRREL